MRFWSRWRYQHQPDAITTIDTEPICEFFAEITDQQCLALIFEHIPDVYLFVKDRESRFVHASQPLLDQLGLKDLSELVGNRDQDHFPEELCETFLKDDRLVFETGEPIIDRVELGFAGSADLDWHITTKIPVHETSGHVKGLIGITRLCREKTLVPPDPSHNGVSHLIEWLNANQNRRVTTGEMAKVAGLSIPALRKQFQETFGVTPQEFELTSRIKSASKELRNPNRSIAGIAMDFGFCDQSAFSNQFKKRIGYTPKEFRNRKD